MSRRKLGSRTVNASLRRLSSIKAIDSVLDLGGTLTVPFYEAAIAALTSKIETYNSLLSTLDGLRSEIKADEAALRNFSEQMLMGVGCKFGKDSYEYKKAGGVRKSERKRPTKALQESVDEGTKSPLGT